MPSMEIDPIEKRRAYMREYVRKRREEDPVFLERQREAGRKSAAKHKVVRQEQTKAWREKNTGAIAEYNKKYGSENPRKRTPNLERDRAQREAWKAKNPDWHKNYNREYTARRYKDDPLFALKLRERTRIRQGLKVRGTAKAGPTSDLLGCSWEEFFQHIERLFTDGMSWENMSTWHVDHIKPLAQFDLADPEQQKAAFHYTNHQPLWALDNLKKGARYG